MTLATLIEEEIKKFLNDYNKLQAVTKEEKVKILTSRIVNQIHPYIDGLVEEVVEAKHDELLWIIVKHFVEESGQREVAIPFNRIRDIDMRFGLSVESMKDSIVVRINE